MNELGLIKQRGSFGTLKASVKLACLKVYWRFKPVSKHEKLPEMVRSGPASKLRFVIGGLCDWYPDLSKKNYFPYQQKIK